MAQIRTSLVFAPYDLRLPIVESCRIYLARQSGASLEVEAEWSLKDVTHWIWSSNDIEARVERFKKHRASIDDVFRSLFNSDPPELRQSAFDRVKDLSKPMMYERTIPSRLLFSMCYFGMTNPTFTLQMPNRLGSILHSLLTSLCEIEDIRSLLTIRQLGTGVRISPGSHMVDASDVWPGGFRETFMKLWQKVAEAGGCPWITTTPNHLRLASFTLFCIDITIVETASCLLAAGVDLLSQLGSKCDSYFLEMITVPASLKRAKIIGSTVQIRKGSKVTACFNACTAIADGNVF